MSLRRRMRILRSEYSQFISWMSFTDWCVGTRAGRLREMAAGGECTGYCI